MKTDALPERMLWVQSSAFRYMGNTQPRAHPKTAMRCVDGAGRPTNLSLSSVLSSDRMWHVLYHDNGA